MPSVFSRIIAGELPGQLVWRDDRCVVFLSINPITPGHALVVPIDEVDQWTDLAPELAAHLMAVAQVVGRAQVKAFAAPRAGLEIAGFEVPHCHLHVLPIWGEADLHLSNSAPSIDPDVLAANAGRLRDALRAIDPAHVVDG